MHPSPPLSVCNICNSNRLTERSVSKSLVYLYIIYTIYKYLLCPVHVSYDIHNMYNIRWCTIFYYYYYLYAKCTNSTAVRNFNMRATDTKFTICSTPIVVVGVHSTHSYTRARAPVCAHLTSVKIHWVSRRPFRIFYR